MGLAAFRTLNYFSSLDIYLPSVVHMVVRHYSSLELESTLFLCRHERSMMDAMTRIDEFNRTRGLAPRWTSMALDGIKASIMQAYFHHAMVRICHEQPSLNCIGRHGADFNLSTPFFLGFYVSTFGCLSFSIQLCHDAQPRMAH